MDKVSPTTALNVYAQALRQLRRAGKERADATLAHERAKAALDDACRVVKLLDLPVGIYPVSGPEPHFREALVVDGTDEPSLRPLLDASMLPEKL